MGRVIQDDGWRISDRVGADVTAITAPAKTGSRPAWSVRRSRPAYCWA